MAVLASPVHNLAQQTLAAAETKPDQLALLVVGGSAPQSLTFHELRDRVLRTAAGLRATGLNPGDRLLMRIANSVDFPILFLAAVAAGVLPIPTAAALTEPEVTAICDLLQPNAIAAMPGLALPRSSAPVLTDFQSLTEQVPTPPVAVTPDDPAYIIMTSGTSGQSRAVLHAHRAMTCRHVMRDDWTGLGPEDRMLHAGAFNWTYTLGAGLIDPWSVGATALIPANGTSPADLPRLIADHNATMFAAAPGVYRQMLRAADWPILPALRHGLSAGEKLPETIRDRWQTQTGTDLIEAYGMSECSTFLSGAPRRPNPTGALGFPQSGVQIDLRTNGASVPPNTPGQIAVHSSEPRLMLGYLRPNGIDLPLEQGWFLTGDLGQLGPDGAVRYHGRADDLLTAGGYRVSPLEVEDALLSHPAVIEAAVVDCQITPETTVIAAHIALSKPTPDVDLAEHIAPKLAAYKRPRLMVRHDALPRTLNGKLLRRSLRDAPLPPTAKDPNKGHDPT